MTEANTTIFKNKAQEYDSGFDNYDEQLMLGIERFEEMKRTFHKTIMKLVHIYYIWKIKTT